MNSVHPIFTQGGRLSDDSLEPFQQQALHHDKEHAGRQSQVDAKLLGSLKDGWGS